MTTKEAAKYLGVSHYYLRNLRHHLHQHEGPKYQYILGKGGKHCIYKLEDLIEWNNTYKRRPIGYTRKPKAKVITDWY